MTAPHGVPSVGMSGDPDGLLDVACAAARAGAMLRSPGGRGSTSCKLSRRPHRTTWSARPTVTPSAPSVRSGAAPAGRRRARRRGGSTIGPSGVRWIVDPIDGTANYLYGRPDWAVSVAAARVADRRLLAAAVAEPVLGRLTAARLGGGTRGAGTRPGGRRVVAVRAQKLHRAIIELNLGREGQKARTGRMVDALVPRVRDIRRGGSAASALAQLATGRADAVWVPGLQPWDCAAGVLLASEAGCVVGDLSGAAEGTWPRSGDVLAAPPALWEPLRALLAGAYLP